jgi:nicotinate-nucleotide adenylyltransferase
VALLSADLAERFGLDSDTAYTAGITHDMCKALDTGTMSALACSDGRPVSADELAKPSLLHGRAAAMWLPSRFGITDSEIIEAVRYHTTGYAGCGPLTKIVYIADKIEFRRATVDPALRRLAMAAASPRDLDALFIAIVRGTVQWLRERDYSVSTETLRILSEE